MLDKNSSFTDKVGRLIMELETMAEHEINHPQRRGTIASAVMTFMVGRGHPANQMERYADERGRGTNLSHLLDEVKNDIIRQQREENERASTVLSNET